MKSKRVKEILPTIVESYELAGKGLGEAVAETLTVYVEFAEQEAEERHAKELKKVFNQGCWTCVQNVSSIVNRNDITNVLTDLIRGLGISEDEAQILSSVDDFRREEIYDAMGWSYYWINKGEQSDE